MIELLTFTGVDTKTSRWDILKIAKKYPKVEFGILVGSHTGLEKSIFPPISTVNDLRGPQHKYQYIHTSVR